VPILNPDGVYRGHYRTDCQGINLNRFYLNPSPEDHPSIYAMKNLALYTNIGNKLQLYLDLHAHASKKGCFLFGNTMDFRMQAEAFLFAKLYSMNSENLDFENCDFSEKNMYAKEKGEAISKEGSARVAIYKATNIPLCFTMECNYNAGRMINVLTVPVNMSGFENESERSKQQHRNKN